ncbi:MAG: hypothetical protein E6I01_13625 [Chloroflexi bacterium]|nr:MAG: hypothetical protein E6I01_13625 [Chloroflexota bacterium]
MLAGDRPLIQRAACAVKLNGEWFSSTAAPLGHADAFALHWQAGPALATARLIPHEGGVVIECELNNTADAPLTFNGWRPLMIEGGGALRVGDEPWRASVLINGFQSWDYAGIHPLDEAITEGDRKPPATSWWTAAICDGQAMFVAQVLRASRFATVFRWHYHRDEHEGDSLPTDIRTFVAEQHGSPLSQPEQRSGMPEELRLAVPPQSGLVSDPILLLYGDDGTGTLRKALMAAGHAAGARSFPTVPRGWCSWYHLGLAVTEADIARHAAFLAKRMPELAKTSTNGYRPVIQVDDGWMPRWQRWGDWVANEFFADGLHALATRVHRHRLEVGIWLAPFHVAADSQLARAHPEWLLKANDGSPLVDARLDKAYHILDPTHPDTLRFLVDLFLGLRRDGFTYYKLDFLSRGDGNAGASARPEAHRRRDQSARETREMLRAGLRRAADAGRRPGPRGQDRRRCRHPADGEWQGRTTAPRLSLDPLDGPQPGRPALLRSIAVRRRRGRCHGGRPAAHPRRGTPDDHDRSTLRWHLHARRRPGDLARRPPGAAAQSECPRPGWGTGGRASSPLQRPRTGGAGPLVCLSPRAAATLGPPGPGRHRGRRGLQLERCCAPLSPPLLRSNRCRRELLRGRSLVATTRRTRARNQDRFAQAKPAATQRATS